MKTKKISSKIAKAIKDAGYPMEYATVQETIENNVYHEDGGEFYSLPTYIEVWLWLWQEKKIYIQVGIKCCTLSFPWGDSCTFKLKNSPEKAIIAAIKYMVDNNFIK